jgi:uncharacterized protein (TIGR03086 family)
MTTDKQAGPAGPGIAALDAEAVQATVRLVFGVTPADLAKPTPCEGWSVRDLLAHMTVQHDGFAAAAAGDGADLAHWQPREAGADPAEEYATAAGRVLAAFAADGALGRKFALPEISPVLRFPAAQAISFHFVDYVVHGWDLARSLGRDFELAPATLEVALVVARAVPDGQARRRGLMPFAPGVPAAAQAPLLDQIVARLGRRPQWPH